MGTRALIANGESTNPADHTRRSGDMTRGGYHALCRSFVLWGGLATFVVYAGFAAMERAAAAHDSIGITPRDAVALASDLRRTATERVSPGTCDALSAGHRCVASFWGHVLPGECQRIPGQHVVCLPVTAAH